MVFVREKFVMRIDQDVLAGIRKIARDEKRPLQSIVEDALRAYVVDHAETRRRPHVMSAYQASLERFGPLYEKLAK
ncbi:hypothetical protein [Methylosinus sp. RM1]|uniref:hypothetical protein n=1 Tax=Methylosinus sp. RM1 TaxID=2583817 RepID=UPI0014086A02|nr:hypothetical protein [Methylosinus sp. RM1]